MSGADLQPPAGNAGDDTQAREQRIAALRSLANAQSPTISHGSASANGASRPKRRRRLPVLLAALVVIVLLTTAGAAWQGWLPWQRMRKTASDKIVSVNLATLNLHCPSAAVWSPDDQQIAVLAQLGACAQIEARLIEPNVVALFNAQGKLERLLYPDRVTIGKNAPTTAQPTPAPGAPPPATVPTFTQYFALSWSPDGRRLALSYQTTFAHDASAPIENITFDSGVALLPADGGDAARLSGMLSSSADIWDLQMGRLIHADATNQPPALVYRWSAHGALQPYDETATRGPVGNPSGGQQFTIWQPGNVIVDREKKSLNFGASVMAWSPDGRYLAAYLGFGGELATGITGVVLQSDGSYQLAPRDEGLLTAASQLKLLSDPYASSIPVAWDSDGHALAALQTNPLLDQIRQSGDRDTVPHIAEHVIVYDCDSGAKRLTLTTKPIANAYQLSDGIQADAVLHWASSGQKLFLLDAAFDILTIWAVSLK